MKTSHKASLDHESGGELSDDAPEGAENSRARSLHDLTEEQWRRREEAELPAQLAP